MLLLSELLLKPILPPQLHVAQASRLVLKRSIILCHAKISKVRDAGHKTTAISFRNTTLKLCHAHNENLPRVRDTRSSPAVPAMPVVR